MSQGMAFALLVAIVVLLFAGLWWLGRIEPEEQSDDDGEPEERPSSDRSHDAGDGGPSIEAD